MVSEPNEFLTPSTIVVVLLQDVCSCCRKSKGNSQRHGSGWLSSAEGGTFVQIILNLKVNLLRQLSVC